MGFHATTMGAARDETGTGTSRREAEQRAAK
jgi:dsRNA-specific ribonuclease